MMHDQPRPACKAGFLCFIDTTGYRHAVRIGAITALRDSDDTQTETLVVLHGRAAVPTPYDLEAVLSAIMGSPHK